MCYPGFTLSFFTPEEANCVTALCEQIIPADSYGVEALQQSCLFQKQNLCNEWNGSAWSPYFVNDPPEAIWTGWHTDKSKQWMTNFNGE